MLELLGFSELSLFWHCDRLMLRRGEEELEFQPSEKHWQSFWASLDHLGVWSWRPKYEDLNVLDGEVWSLTLRYDDKTLHCSGSNHYPPTWNRLCWAINDLLGIELFSSFCPEDVPRGLSKPLRTLESYGPVNSVAVTADGKRAVSACDDTLKLWDLESGEELLSFPGSGYPLNSVAITADGRRAVCASNDGTLKVWDLESRQERSSSRATLARFIV